MPGSPSTQNSCVCSTRPSARAVARCSSSSRPTNGASAVGRELGRQRERQPRRRSRPFPAQPRTRRPGSARPLSSSIPMSSKSSPPRPRASMRTNSEHRIWPGSAARFEPDRFDHRRAEDVVVAVERRRRPRCRCAATIGGSRSAPTSTRRMRCWIATAAASASRGRMERREDAVARVLDDGAVVLLDDLAQDLVVDLLELVGAVLTEARRGWPSIRPSRSRRW